jgi:uncharacterized protein YqjF (DUF2071 family)
MMKLPVIQGIIDRRVLLNWHVDPVPLSRILPPPFRPQLVNGFGIAGVCLIRLKEIRPKFLPRGFGLSSENGAHRIAVEWDEEGERKVGVYIPRRDTNSRMNVLAGGRLFPGLHHHASFDVKEDADGIRIDLKSADASTRVTVEGRPASSLPAGSVFGSLEEASAFFEAGSLGFSATNTPGCYDGLELRCEDWQVQPLEVMQAESSFFSEANFPAGSAAFDCALLMRGVKHQWIGREQLVAELLGARV